MFAALLIPTIVHCRISAFLEGLDDASRKNLESAMSLPRTRVTHRRIASEIFDETAERIDPETIAAHRNGACRCSKR